MKRILVILSVCAAALTLSACQKTERAEPVIVFTAQGAVKDPEPESKNDAVSEPEPEPQPEPEETPVHIEDIHEWAEDNALYNINTIYELTGRYYLPYERTDSPAALWYGSGNIASDESYDADKAVEFAREHWNDGLDVCAPFISRCLKAGGLSIGSDSSTGLCLMLLDSGLGFGQFLPINDDRTVTLPDYAAPGDVVQLYCPYEGLMIHSLIFVGNNENGAMKVCCHNSKNSGKYAFKCDKYCYSCLSGLKEVFYFHFYGEEELNEPMLEDENVRLFENSGYVSPDLHYDRKSAVRAVMNAPIDGLGQFGAQQTSAALTAGGLEVGTPIQTALFMRLVKSRLGEAYTLPVNADRTVTLPDFAGEGDVCFLYCSDEALIYSSFIVKGVDVDGKMLGYTRDRVNDENTAFRVESVCPSSICDGEITEVLLFHFSD